MGESKITLLGIAGSLRKASYNKALLRAARQLVPADTEIVIFDDLGNIPLFDQDLERDMPESVRGLKDMVLAADGILFVTPEYNYSVPGVLKNAIDWVSRPYASNAWRGKPVGLMGASTSVLGTARAQYHLRQSLVYLDMYAMNKPEMMVARAAEKFDDNGNLTDPETREKLKEYLEAMRKWTVKLNSAPEAFWV